MQSVRSDFDGQKGRRCGLSGLIVAGSLAVFAPVDAQASDRAAVVIENSAYATKPITTAAADAGLISSALREMDFDVLLIDNVNKDAVGRLPAAIGSHFKDKKIKFVYFVG